jgi:hypothetical protein
MRPIARLGPIRGLKSTSFTAAQPKPPQMGTGAGSEFEAARHGGGQTTRASSTMRGCGLAMRMSYVAFAATTSGNQHGGGEERRTRDIVPVWGAERLRSLAFALDLITSITYPACCDAVSLVIRGPKDSGIKS